MDNTQLVQLTQDDVAEVKRLLDAAKVQDQAPVLTDQALLRWREQHAERTGNMTAGQKYRAFRAALADVARSNDPRDVAAFAAANRGLVDLRTKGVLPGDVHTNSTLSNVSVQYANEAYVGTELMPVVQVAKEGGVIPTYGQSDRLRLPNDQMADGGEANEIEETRSTTSYACECYGLSNRVSVRTLQNQDAPLDEMVDVVEAIADIEALQREVRIAAIAGAAGSYGANTAVIPAADRWNTAGGGNPIADIQTAMDACWQGFGGGEWVFFSSSGVYNVLSRHPDILALFQYNGSSPGLATPAMIAKFFGAADYFVTKARYDSSAEGAAAAFLRVWPDVFGIVRRGPPSIRNAAFGWVLRCGQPLTQVEFKPLAGHGGSYKAQVSVLEDELVVAATTSYLLTSPI
jgi:hypothetical protein